MQKDADMMQTKQEITLTFMYMCFHQIPPMHLKLILLSNDAFLVEVFLGVIICHLLILPPLYKCLTRIYFNIVYTMISLQKRCITDTSVGMANQQLSLPLYTK